MYEQADIDHPQDEPHDDGKEAAGQKASGIKSVFANKKSRNHILIVGSILAVVALAGVAVMRRASKAESIPADARGVSALPAAGQMDKGPTALSDSPAYKAVLDDVSAQRVTTAEAAGKSAFPLSATLRAPEAGSPNDPHLSGTAAMYGDAAASSAQRQAQIQTQMREAQEAATRRQAEEQRLQVQFGEQVNLVTKFINERQAAWAPRGTDLISYGERSTLPGAKATDSKSQTALAVAAAGSAPAGKVLIAAGTLVSAVTVNRVSTDVKAPVVATIVSGPFAGAKLIGSEVRQGELAKIDFTTMSIPGVGASVPVQAFTLDAESMIAGVATEVDRKLFTRYLLAPAAAAISAVGTAAMTAGTAITSAVSTTTTIPLGPRQAALIAGGALAGQVTKEIAAQGTDPTVYVASKTVVGVMFVADVVYTQK